MTGQAGGKLEIFSIWIVLTDQILNKIVLLTGHCVLLDKQLANYNFFNKNYVKEVKCQIRLCDGGDIVTDTTLWRTEHCKWLDKQVVN